MFVGYKKYNVGVSKISGLITTYNGPLSKYINKNKFTAIFSSFNIVKISFCMIKNGLIVMYIMMLVVAAILFMK